MQIGVSNPNVPIFPPRVCTLVHFIIIARRQVYKKVVNGRKDLWGEYCRLRKEVKQLVIEKKLNIWNELVEKVNTDFDVNRKEFWAFVGRKSKGKNI